MVVDAADGRAGRSKQHLLDVIGWLGWDKLMFATDYPHWDYDEPSRVLPAGVSKENRDAFYPRQRAQGVRYRCMTRHVVAPVDELPPGSRKFLTIDERPIAIFNIKGEFFGLLNRCPHQGAALCEGPLIGLAEAETRARSATRGAARSCAAPGTAGSSTSAPANPTAIRRNFACAPMTSMSSRAPAVVKGPYVAETLAVSVENDYVVVDLVGRTDACDHLTNQ